MTTISAENAKNVRRSMDVFIEISPTDFPTITITNENLINCTVSLRADLSKWEPTLPESEINIEAFFDADISDYAAGIPDGTPVTYSAGYPGDMSPTRKFYLSEQITWSDNVLHIHAVDRVHELDNKQLPAIALWPYYNANPGTSYYCGNTKIYTFLLLLLREHLGAGTFQEENAKLIERRAKMWLYFESGLSPRSVIAHTMNQFHISGQWPTYVDAGIPSITFTKPSSKWTINEDDCSAFLKNTDRQVKTLKINHTWTDVTYGTSGGLYSSVGSAEWTENIGASLSVDSLALFYAIGFDLGPNIDNDIAQTLKAAGYSNIYNTSNGVLPVIPTSNDGGMHLIGPSYPRMRIDDFYNIALKLNSGTPQEDFESYPAVPDKKIYSIFVPWNCKYAYGGDYPYFWPTVEYGTTINSQADAWNFYASAGVIDADTESVSLSVVGKWAPSRDELLTYNGAANGEEKQINAIYQGNMYIDSTNVYPEESYKSILARSDRTGTFTWKGDPRMQPRDVFTLTTMEYGLLNEDGEVLTDENGVALNGGGGSLDCTIETITLTHAGGGLSAEITYREGIC